VAFSFDISCGCFDKWTLTFGDAAGVVASGTELTAIRNHVYGSCGVFEATLVAVDIFGRESTPMKKTISIACPTAPPTATPTATPCPGPPVIVSFEVDPAYPPVPETPVAFSFDISCGCFDKWTLTFGDAAGAVASGSELTAIRNHVYGSCGVFEATLVAVDIFGRESAPMKKTISIGCPTAPPTATPTATPCPPPAIDSFFATPQTVNLGSATQLEWIINSYCLDYFMINYGDSQGESSIYKGFTATGTVSHTYAQCGKYTAQMYAVDKFGRQTLVASTEITVLCPPTATPTPTPCAPPSIVAFTASNNAGVDTVPVRFGVEVASNCLDKWTLQFGDSSAVVTGNSASGTVVNHGGIDHTSQSVDHTYTSCGVFVAELYAVDTYGRQTLVSQQQIVVSCPTATPTATPAPPSVECWIDSFVAWKLYCTVKPSDVPTGRVVQSSHVVIEQSDEVTFTATAASTAYELKYRTMNAALPAAWFATAMEHMPWFSASTTSATPNERVQHQGFNDLRTSQIDMTPEFVQTVNTNVAAGADTTMLFMTSQQAEASGFFNTLWFPVKSYCRVTIVLNLAP